MNAPPQQNNNANNAPAPGDYPFRISRSMAISDVARFLPERETTVDPSLSKIQLGSIAVRDARLSNVYYYCLVVRFSGLMALAAAAGAGTDPRRLLSSSLKDLRTLGAGRLCIAWHAAEESVTEEMLNVVNEACMAEQTPLVCAASAREAAQLIFAVSRPTGVRNARQSAFGKSATSVNAKTAALLIHTMATQMLSEAEAVRVVDAFAVDRPGSTPADLIEFLGSKATAKEASLFLQKKGLVQKAKAERVVAVFCSNFTDNQQANAAAAAAALLVDPSRARRDETNAGAGPIAPVLVGDTGIAKQSARPELSESAFEDLLGQLEQRLEQRLNAQEQQLQQQNATRRQPQQQPPPPQQPQQQQQPIRFAAFAAEGAPPPPPPVYQSRKVQHQQQQQRPAPPQQQQHQQTTVAESVAVLAARQRALEEQRIANAHNNMSEAMAAALRRANMDSDDDEFA